MDGTMPYLLERVDGGGGEQGAGKGGGGGGGHLWGTLDEFIAAVPASLPSNHGLAWKQVASTVSCRDVHAFGGAPRWACVDCSVRGAQVKPRGDIKAAAQGDGDYSAFVAASAAVAVAVTEPSQLPCSTPMAAPGDTSGWPTVATAFENHYVTHVTSAVKFITKCIVLYVYPQAPGGLDGQRRGALIAALVAGLQAADGTRPPSFKWPAGKVSASDGAAMAAGATLAYDTVLVYAGGDGRQRCLLQLDTSTLRQRSLHVYPLLRYAHLLCIRAGVEAADTSPGRAATCTAFARVGGALLRRRLASAGVSLPASTTNGLFIQTLLRRARIVGVKTVVGPSIVSDGVGVHFTIRHPASAASTAAARWARRKAASDGRGGGGCWDSKIVPLSYSHNTGVNGPEVFKLIVQHSS